jgi:hypothetical protein
MFTCGDEPPPQYADVFWYFHEPRAHGADLEAPRRADSFIRSAPSVTMRIRIAPPPPFHG